MLDVQKINILIWLIVLLKEIKSKKNREKYREKNKELLDQVMDMNDYLLIIFL
jgi:hypothetical protein